MTIDADLTPKQRARRIEQIITRVMDTWEPSVARDAVAIYAVDASFLLAERDRLVRIAREAMDARDATAALLAESRRYARKALVDRADMRDRLAGQSGEASRVARPPATVKEIPKGRRDCEVCYGHGTVTYVDGPPSKRKRRHWIGPCPKCHPDMPHPPAVDEPPACERCGKLFIPMFTDFRQTTCLECAASAVKGELAGGGVETVVDIGDDE